MAQWRGVVITNPARLSLKDGQIVIAQGEESPVTLPPEDVAFIVFDTREYQITGGLLSKLADCAVAVIVTDAKHIPNGVLLPYAAHFKAAGTARKQLAASQGLKDKLRRKLITAKIRGQAFTLEAAGGDPTALLREAEAVKPGDPDNREARAARIYWERMMPVSRDGDGADIFNICLNYAYAVARAVLSRTLVAYGFMPAFGIFHANALNAFNLSDDLIEPYRPVIDGFVFKHIRERDEAAPFATSDKRALAAIMTRNIDIAGEKTALLTALEETVKSFARCLDKNSVTSLIIPEIDPKGQPKKLKSPKAVRKPAKK